MDMDKFIANLKNMIYERRKMTSSLYQVIMAGEATQRLLQEVVVNRWPIKNLWTRALLGIASRVDDYHLRCALIENIYEEETGAITGSSRHVQTFIDFGESVGVSRETIENRPLLPETRAVCEFNAYTCNNFNVHFTAGVASDVFLMEGQPPIVNEQGQSMLQVMRDVYQLPPQGYEFFIHHASSAVQENHVSALEDDHTDTARSLMRKYCTTPELQQQAIDCLAKAIDLRHRHFDAILENYYDPNEPPFRWQLWNEQKMEQEQRSNITEPVRV